MSEDNVEIDDLVGEIKKLQQLIKQDRTVIGANETRTRNDLIDPLLRALGWDNSSVRTVEYDFNPGHFRSKKVDYALHPRQRGQPVAIIEAKRMWEDDITEHIEQARSYAEKRKSVKYIGLTNGDRWVFYDVLDADRSVLDISISSGYARSCAVQLLQFKLGGELLGTGKPVQRATTPKQRFIDGIREAVSHDSASTVVVRNVLAWLGLFTLLGVIAGYVIGFRAAQPVLEGLFGLLGVAALLVVVIVGVVLILLRRPWRRLSLSWFWPIEGDVRKILIWSCCGPVGGSLGLILGHAVGIRTAQPIYDMIELVGVIFFLVLFSAVMLTIMVKSGRSQESKRPRHRGRR